MRVRVIQPGVPGFAVGEETDMPRDLAMEYYRAGKVATLSPTGTTPTRARPRNRMLDTRERDRGNRD